MKASPCNELTPPARAMAIRAGFNGVAGLMLAGACH